MKKPFTFYSLFLLLQTCFADIPLDDNGHNRTTFSDFNYLPWALGALAAAAILIITYVLKNEKNANK